MYQNPLKRLFVYGIFLSEANRLAYGMSDPHYATVKDYATYGNHIVTAHKVPNAGLALTGLVVRVDPTQWGRLDSLEAGYKRSTVRTTDGEEVFMYTG